MKKGFTLIELLVVISIIGLLSSIVLASLKSARDKGGDAAIKENMVSLRTQAEIYYSNNGNYGADFYNNADIFGAQLLTLGSCDLANGTHMFSDPKIVQLLTVIGQIGTGYTGTQALDNVTCGARAATASSPASWIVIATLKTQPPQDGEPALSTNYICADYTGVVKTLSLGLGELSQGMTRCP